MSDEMQPSGPQPVNLTEVMQENAALREENARLRNEVDDALADAAKGDHLRAQVAALVTATHALLEKIAACEKALEPIYSSAFLHGVQYDGPTYTAERERVQTALDALNAGKTP